jgi:trigger factor
MQVTVSRVSPVEVSLRIALPRERVSNALDAAFNEIARKAQLPGFRKGKVPRPLIKQYWGGSVAEQVARKLVDETLVGALRDQNIDPINTPSIEVDQLTGTTEWTYTARLEVRPEIGTLDLSGLQLTRTVYPVGEEAVEKALQSRRENAATLRTPDPMRAVAQDDTVTVNLTFRVDGQTLSEFASTGRAIEVGKGATFREIDAVLPGMNVGDSRDADVSFPDSHRMKLLAGKTATITVTVTALQETVLPDVDDEFAKDIGKESLADLRASLRLELEAAATERSNDEVHSAAVDALVKNNAVPVPPSLIDQAAAAIRQEFTRGFAMRNMTLPPELEASLRSDAEQRMRAGLLLTEFARVEGVQVTDADIEAHFETLSKETGKAVQRLRVEYREKAKRDQLVAQVLETKVLAVLLSKATITDKIADADAKAE